MADAIPQSLRQLIKVFAKLPGVGNRTALRYALHLVREGPEVLSEMAGAMNAVAEKVHLCQRCFGLTEFDDICQICRDPSRETGSLCVVEGIGDILALEAAGLYQGRYFVLHRLLSPLKGIGPKDLRIDNLLKRVPDENIEEVVLATPSTTDGETTATFLSRVLTQKGVRVTRLAAGIPVGGSIEYLDRMTLSRAFADRKDV